MHTVHHSATQGTGTGQWPDTRERGGAASPTSKSWSMESLLWWMPLTGTEPIGPRVSKLAKANQSPNTTHHEPNNKTSYISSSWHSWKLFWPYEQPCSTKTAPQ